VGLPAWRWRGYGMGWYSQKPSSTFGRHQPPVRTHRPWRASAVSAGGIGGVVQPASSSPLSTGRPPRDHAARQGPTVLVRSAGRDH